MTDFSKSFVWLSEEILRKEVGLLRSSVSGIKDCYKPRTQKLFKDVFIIPEILRQFKVVRNGSIKSIQKGKNNNILIIVLKILEIGNQANHQIILMNLKKIAYNQKQKFLDLMPLEKDIQYTQISIKKTLVEFFHLVKPNPNSKNIVNLFNKYSLLENILVSLIRHILYNNGVTQALNLQKQLDIKTIISVLSKVLDFQYKLIADQKLFLFDNDHFISEEQNTIYFNSISLDNNQIDELNSEDSIQKDDKIEKQYSDNTRMQLRSFSQFQFLQQNKPKYPLRQNIEAFSPEHPQKKQIEETRTPYYHKYGQSQPNSPQKQYFNRYSEGIDAKINQKNLVQKMDSDRYIKKVQQTPITFSTNNLANNRSSPLINLNRTNSINAKINYVKQQKIEPSPPAQQVKSVTKQPNIVFNNNVKIYRLNQIQKPTSANIIPVVKNNLNYNQEIQQKKYFDQITKQPPTTLTRQTNINSINNINSISNINTINNINNQVRGSRVIQATMSTNFISKNNNI